MSFANILKRTVRPDERITLLKFINNAKEDELGFPIKDYVEIQELHGVIQEPENVQTSRKGVESNPEFVGYFLPDFEIPTHDVDDYRLKYERPFEELILKITTYDPNLFLRHKRDHIQLSLVLEKKHGTEYSS